MDGGASRLLGGARPGPPRAAKGQGSRRAGVEARRQRVGGADERRGLLQGGAWLQEASLLLERRRLAVQGGRGWERRPQEGRGLVEGGRGAGRHRSVS